MATLEENKTTLKTEWNNIMKYSIDLMITIANFTHNYDYNLDNISNESILSTPRGDLRSQYI